MQSCASTHPTQHNATTPAPISGNTIFSFLHTFQAFHCALNQILVPQLLDDSPVIRRIKAAEHLLKDVGASEESVQQAILKALDTQATR